MRNASRAMPCHVAGSISPSRPVRPPPPALPDSRRPSCSTMTEIFSRAMGRVSRSRSAIGAQDFDLLVRRRQRDRHLHHPLVLRAQVIIHLRATDPASPQRTRPQSGPHLCIAAGLSPAAHRPCAAAITHRQTRGLGGAAQGVHRQVGGMGIARHLAAHSAQAKPFGGIEAGGFDALVIQQQRFGRAAFQKNLAIIGARRSWRAAVASASSLSRIESKGRKSVGAHMWSFCALCRAAAPRGRGCH
jgi:hypothetical protein